MVLQGVLALRLFILIALTTFTGLAQAKDLGHRLGVGFTNQFGLDQELPSVALRYFPNQDYGVAGAIGVDTTKNNSRFGFQGKIIKLIYREDNLNFYTGASAGVVSREKDSKTDSGFDLTGILGVEFFFAGLENLGFCMEAGVGVTSVSSEVRFRTIGDHPLRAGIFFYF